jgi:hypothetical protein
MKHSQPESGFGETLSSNFTSSEKDNCTKHGYFECGLSDEFDNFDEPLHEESFEDGDNYHHHRNHLNDDPVDNEWGGGSLCGCYECLGRLQIERIVTADKCTMFPDEPPYILTCEILFPDKFCPYKHYSILLPNKFGPYKHYSILLPDKFGPYKHYSILLPDNFGPNKHYSILLSNNFLPY